MSERSKAMPPTKHRSAVSRRREMVQIAFLAGMLGVVLHAIGFFVFRISPPEAKIPASGQKPAHVIWFHPMQANAEVIGNWEEWLTLRNPKALYFSHFMEPDSHSGTAGFDTIELFPGFHPNPSLEDQNFAFHPRLLPEERVRQPKVVSSSRHEALLQEFGRTREIIPHMDSSPLSFRITHLDTGEKIASGKISLSGDALPGVLWDQLSFNLTVVDEIPSLPFFKVNSSGHTEFDQAAMNAFRQHPHFKTLAPGNYQVVLFP